MRNEFRTGIKDIYSEYDNPHNLSQAEFATIIKTFNYLFIKSMIDQGYIYKLPNSLGIMLVAKKKQKRKGVMDFKHYMQTGERQFITNNHSGGFRAHFTWIMKKNYGKMYKGFANLATFKPVRYFKRYLADCIKNRQTMNNYTQIHYD